MTLGLYGSGCLALIGLFATCSIIGIGLGTPLLLFGFLGMVGFGVARMALK